MSTQWRELSAQLLERTFTRREFLLYLLALVPVIIGLNGLIKRLLEAGHHVNRQPSGYGSRTYGK